MISRFRIYLAGPGLGPTLVKATVGTAGLRFLGMGFAFLVGVQLARGLGAEGYGVYGIAMSVIALLGLPTEFGLPQLVTREMAAASVHNDQARVHGILRWSFRSVCLLSVIVALATMTWLVASGKGLGSPLGMAILVGLTLVPVVALSNLKSAALRGLQHIVKGQLADSLVRPAVFSLLLLLLPIFFSTLNPVSAMTAGVVSAALSLIVATVLLRKYIPRLATDQREKIDSKGLWASAFPMAMTEGIRGIEGNAAVLIMGLLTAEASVGVFRVALSVSSLISLPVTLFILIGSPVISRLFSAGDLVRLQKLLGWLAGGMMVGSLVMLLPFLFQGEWLLGRVFGEEFRASNTPLLILGFGGVLFSAFGPCVILLNMTGHERRVTRAFLISVALLLACAFPLVHFFGAVGAAIANVIGMLSGALLMWRDSDRFLHLDGSVFALQRNWQSQ